MLRGRQRSLFTGIHTEHMNPHVQTHLGVDVTEVTEETEMYAFASASKVL